LKIHHALKETSYLTDAPTIADSPALAITIGNYLLATGARPRQNHFASIIYNPRPGGHAVHPCGETAMPQASQPSKGKSNTMGDRSPKSNQKKSNQKQAKTSSADQKKKQAAAAKQSAAKKK
jgi:hypothetical protein